LILINKSVYFWWKTRAPMNLPSGLENENEKGLPLKAQERMISLERNLPKKAIIKAYAKLRYQLKKELNNANLEGKENIKIKLEQLKIEFKEELDKYERRILNGCVTVEEDENTVFDINTSYSIDDFEMFRQEEGNTSACEISLPKQSEAVDQDLLESKEANTVTQPVHDLINQSKEFETSEIKTTEPETRLEKGFELEQFEVENKLNIHKRYDDLEETLNRKLADEGSEEYSSMRFCGFSIFRC
jgi:hypothetical protein